ncbi:hypothetical protein C5Y96_15080 [Blastopirellula marina]|uniref:Uncharacterized protein n=1 Tax=Blastopirellula marina TaxID=124 RepID=A0A2S8FDN4_9BACT|nr:hypothetical protein C5Y96_15080 [Blastopirellula marina]RCS50469.1 hypothetical protein DTL36_15090 [Bremerella cremea]
MLRCLQGVRFHLSDNISPVRAFLVIFYAVLVVGGLLQTDFSLSGKLTSPHSHDSGLAEVAEIEAESKVETQLSTLTPNWTIPTFEVTSTFVLSDFPAVTVTRQHTVSCLRGPPVA